MAEKREINLEPSDFEVTSDGKVVIKDPELAALLSEASDPAEEDGLSINFWCKVIEQ